MPPLGPETAHIFRITHVQNVPWILQHGLHCKNSSVQDPNFHPIGLAELIEKRASHLVTIPPGGTLSDYVPFYFTPWSIMMYNIKTGHNGVKHYPNSEIAILVSSLPRLQSLGLPFVFTNAHAYMKESTPFNDLADLDKIDWGLLRSKNFTKDIEDPGKLGRYQAEALVHQHVPINALHGIACSEQSTQDTLQAAVAELQLNLQVKVLSDWYF